MKTAVIGQRVRLFVIGSYLWLMMLLLGSLLLETSMVYPNIFRNPPESFAVALEFMTVRAPHDIYPPVGFLSWVLGAFSLAAGWRNRRVRIWILISLATIVGEGLLSRAYFWPRNTIMFVEGPAVHSVAVLRQTAEEFQRMHWWRVAFNAVSAAAIFQGFLACYARYVANRDATA